MSTGTTLETLSRNSGETEKIAAKLAQLLQGGETIELKSDLGGGKTTFVRGLVAGLKSTDHVASPTFMISKEYASPKFRIIHFDFYRLHSAGDMKQAMQEALLDNNTICLVEWGDVVAEVLPEDRIIVELERLSGEEDSRRILISSVNDQLLKEFAL